MAKVNKVTTNEAAVGTTDLNDVSGGGDFIQREPLGEGDYPVLELISVEDSESAEFGKYTYVHVKVIASEGDDATPAGQEAKIGIKRDATGKLGQAKAISLVSFLKVVAGGKDPGDRNEFLSSLKAGGGKGARFGANLELAGRAKKYTFRRAEES